MITQTSCSELLVDTSIHNPEVAFARFTELFAALKWSSSPPLSIAVLAEIKANGEARTARARAEDYDTYIPTMQALVFDALGNSCYLEYGDNGYLDTGFRFDSNCDHVDSKCFPIFKVAIERLGGKLIACDGGSTYCYEEWEEEQEKEDDD